MMFASTSVLVAAMTTYGWEPGPGDPSKAGWIIFASYLVVSAFLWHTARREQAAGQDTFLWRVLAVACLVLAINKQLDLHNAITSLGRNLARAEGWYEQRRNFQLGLILAVLAAGGLAIWWTVRRLGANRQRHRLTLAGMITLIGFIALRAASFHHLDALLRMEYGTVRLHAVIEFSGICFLFLAAWQAARSR